LEEAIRARAELLSGFKGNPKVDKKKWEEAIKPTNIAISLSGEPTLYPKLSELIEESHKLGMKTFLVTNGTMPKVLEELDPLPWQLYVTLPAPDKETYVKLCRPVIKDGWERLNKTLELLQSLSTRKVIRLTMVKGWNMINPKSYRKLIEKAQPDFIEVKAYEWVGESQKRLPMEAMPFMDDIRNFARKIADETSYIYKDEFKPSGVVLLSKT
jgi:tRNA wybutosine-synthesizing protein 1